MLCIEDMDNISTMLENMQRKNKCIHLRIGDSEVVDGLKGLRHMQLSMLYYGLRLEDPTDDVVPDVEVTWMLLDEFPVYAQVNHVHTRLVGFVVKVEEDYRTSPGLHKGCWMA
jgi:hypothetical protein